MTFRLYFVEGKRDPLHIPMLWKRIVIGLTVMFNAALYCDPQILQVPV